MEPTIQDLNARINNQLLALESKISAPDLEKSLDLRSSSISHVINTLRNTKQNFMNQSLSSPTQSRICSLVRPRHQIMPISHHLSIQNRLFMVPRPSLVAVAPPRFLTDASEMESSIRMRTPIMVKTFHGRPECILNAPILQILKKKKEQLTKQYPNLNFKLPTWNNGSSTNNDLSSPTYTEVKNGIKKDPFPPASDQIKQLIKRQLIDAPFAYQSKKKIEQTKTIDQLELQESEIYSEIKADFMDMEQQLKKVSDSEQDFVSVPTKSTVVSPSNTGKKQISFPQHRRSSVQVQNYEKVATKKPNKAKESKTTKEASKEQKLSKCEKETKCVKPTKETKETQTSDSKRTEQNFTALQERFKQRLSEVNIIPKQSLSQTKVVYADLTQKRRGTTFMKRD